MPKIHKTPRKRQGNRPTEGMTFEVLTDLINRRTNVYVRYDSDDRYQIIEFEARDAMALSDLLKKSARKLAGTDEDEQ